MRALKIVAITFFAGVCPLGGAFAQMSATPTGVRISGGMLTDAKGMTLYTFDKDTVPGKSACNGQCLANWPALIATPSDMAMGDWTVITRDDGGKQWAYKGKPLYTFAHHAKAGDMTGDGKGGV